MESNVTIGDSQLRGGSFLQLSASAFRKRAKSVIPARPSCDHKIRFCSRELSAAFKNKQNKPPRSEREVKGSDQNPRVFQREKPALRSLRQAVKRVDQFC